MRLLSVFLCLVAASAHAAPNTLGFDGRLLDAAGEALNGPKIVRVSLHTDPILDTEVWFEEHGVTTSDGYFHVNLGATTALAPVLDANGSLWVQTTIGADDLGGRTPLNAAAYSVSDSDTLADLVCDVGDGLRWDGSGWACAPAPPAIQTFECLANPWAKVGNTQICNVDITLTEASLVVATIEGHWSTSSTSTWCMVEIQFPGDVQYHQRASGYSPYANHRAPHGYPGAAWQPFSSTRRKVLTGSPGGTVHSMSAYVSSSDGSCSANGSALRGWIIPVQ